MSTRPCPACDYPNKPAGKLGRTTWYFCRHCGWHYSKEIKR